MTPGPIENHQDVNSAAPVPRSVPDQRDPPGFLRNRPPDQPAFCWHPPPQGAMSVLSEGNPQPMVRLPVLSNRGAAFNSSGCGVLPATNVSEPGPCGSGGFEGARAGDPAEERPGQDRWVVDPDRGRYQPVDTPLSAAPGALLAGPKGRTGPAPTAARRRRSRASRR
jgi:hypothetical protein